LFLRPFSRGAVGVVRQRVRRSLRDSGGLGRVRVPLFPRRRQAAIGARCSLLSPRAVRSQGAFRFDRPGVAAGLLGLMAPTARGGPPFNTRRADRDFRLRRLVELLDRPHPQQHSGLRLVTSSNASRRFAFAFGAAFALCYAIAVGWQLALFTVFPSLGIVLPGTVQSRDYGDPALGFLAPAMYWYGWTATAALGAFAVGLIAALFPDRWGSRFWSGWVWVAPAAAGIVRVNSILPARAPRRAGAPLFLLTN